MKRIRIRPLGFLFLLNTALLAALVAALIWRFAAPAAQPSPPPARAAASLPPVTEALPPVTEAPFQAMPVAQAPATEPPAIAADWYLARAQRSSSSGRTSPATRPSLGRSWAAAARSATTRRRTRTCAM